MANIIKDDVTYTKLIQSSINSASSLHGKVAQSHIIKMGHNPSVFLTNTLMNMYLKWAKFGSVHKVFDEMSERNVVSWNMLIYEYAKRVFREARGMDVGFSRFTYGSVLSVCGKTGDLELGRVVHGMIVVSGVDGDAFLSNSLVGMYSKCGRVDMARVVFKKLGYVDERLTVNHHSEKLATTLGLLSLPLSAPVRVMKNLRVCQDCHNVMKLISEVEK